MDTISREQLDRSVVVWITRVSQAPEPLACLDYLLDDRERERAARFRFVEDRTRFVLGRSMVRHALGLCLGRKPETIALAYSDRKRPFFPEEASLHFSISHTRDIVAVALASRARVGIDIEFIKPAVELNELAERILSAEDLKNFSALTQPEAVLAFFRVWTRKEAYLKARSEGIANGLQAVSVSLADEEIGTLVDSRAPAESGEWRLHQLAVGKDYAGALACDRPDRPLECLNVQLKKAEHYSDIKLTSLG